MPHQNRGIDPKRTPGFVRTVQTCHSTNPAVAPDLSNISLTITIQSSESEDAVARVYQAWQERCPVYLALTKALSVTTTLDIKRA
jgi:uncharacterized OsmC-like protein